VSSLRLSVKTIDLINWIDRRRYASRFKARRVMSAIEN
jgi:hypothetical protein